MACDQSGHEDDALQIPEESFLLLRDIAPVVMTPYQSSWTDPAATELEIAYRLDVNEFRGQRSLQLIVEQLAAC